MHGDKKQTVLGSHSMGNLQCVKLERRRQEEEESLAVIVLF